MRSTLLCSCVMPLIKTASMADFVRIGANPLLFTVSVSRRFFALPSPQRNTNGHCRQRFFPVPGSTPSSIHRPHCDPLPWAAPPFLAPYSKPHNSQVFFPGGLRRGAGCGAGTTASALLGTTASAVLGAVSDVVPSGASWEGCEVVAFGAIAHRPAGSEAGSGE